MFMKTVVRVGNVIFYNSYNFGTLKSTVTTSFKISFDIAKFFIIWFHENSNFKTFL